MREILVMIVLALLPMTTVRAAEPYQLPSATVCSGRSGCAITIDDEGFLRDSTSHEKVLDLPFGQTVFDSYSLLRVGEYYIVERSNTTSSRTWDLLLLTYARGSAHIERMISLSRSFAMTSPAVYWGGYECRGDAILDRRYSPFDAAKQALCGESHRPDSVNMGKILS